MSFYVTARKYRPQNFYDVVGQEYLTKAIKNAIISGKIPHAYLFSGARGVGKTTTARILAKALNCLDLKDAEPCNKCRPCIEITNGYSMDVIEIDGASNRGIDNIREIRDNVAFLPISSKYKVYIIDEVHMLTTEASNALLKTLEEPPSHVIFILATTEPHKVLPTIKSRCQHYIFKKIPLKLIINQLKKICDSEYIKYTEEALFLIASYGDGSMRDAQSILDQIILYSNGNITEQSVVEVLGIPEIKYYKDLIESLKNNDIINMLRTFHKFLNEIGDIKLYIKGLINFLRDGLLVKKLEINDDLLDMTESMYNELKQLFADFKEEEIINIIQILTDLYKELKGDTSERVLTEMILFKLLDYKNIIPLSEIRNEILQLISKPSSSPNVQSDNRVVVNYSNIQKNIQNTDSTLNMVENKTEEKPIDNINVDSEPVKKTLYNILSSSQIMKNLINQIESLRIENTHIYITMKTTHSFEFFNSSREKIEKVLSNELKNDYHLHIKLNKENPTNILKNDNKKDVETNKISNINEKKNEKIDPTISKIADLFEGKIC